MRVYTSVESIAPPLDRPVVTLGNFDGVHRGHQAIISRTLEFAENAGRDALLTTFRPHPLKVIRPDTAPPLLMDHEEKMLCIQELGVEHCLVIPFTPAFAQIPADNFVRMVLHDTLKASAVFVGNNFNFGRGREGNVELLRRLGGQLEIEVPEVRDFLVLGSPVSSSRIRRAIQSGEVELARELLGRPFTLTGTVVRGESRGAKLGFPTANMKTSSEILPGDGVYVTRAVISGGEFAAVTNVGNRPTFHQASHAVETHFLEPPGDLYDQNLSVQFLSRLRPEVRFASQEQLVRQIAADVARARKYFQASSPEPAR
jgi:riboflavin kinase / FMN adenylyltransferase